MHIKILTILLFRTSNSIFPTYITNNVDNNCHGRRGAHMEFGEQRILSNVEYTLYIYIHIFLSAILHITMAAINSYFIEIFWHYKLLHAIFDMFPEGAQGTSENGKRLID